jgi:(p)ppGpp synthase/HD superfamily hydrolase
VTLERAIVIAAEAHADQKDKASDPYILHPLRVMLAVKAPDERIAAVLHDVVEDTSWTLDALRAEGFSSDVVAAVDALTRRDGEEYFEFVQRAVAHRIARPVKIADLRDNLNRTRVVAPTSRDSERFERYREALRMLGEPV